MIKLTKILLIVGVLAYIAYDIFAVLTPGATISEVIRAWAYDHPALPFAVGFVCGHWFWAKK